jgi:hypothetical protein
VKDRHRTAALILPAALVLSGCAVANPGPSTTRPLVVTVAQALPSPPASRAGQIDSRSVTGQDLTVSGWAELSDTDAASVTVVTRGPVTVVSAYRTVRPDVTVATGDRRLVWSGISVTLRGTTVPPGPVCITSSDPVFGTHVLIGSDTRGCAS